MKRLNGKICETTGYEVGSPPGCGVENRGSIPCFDPIEMKKGIRYFKLLSARPTGLRSPLVTVEIVIAPGIPRHHVVGLAYGAVKESLVRIRAAIQRAGFDFPRGAVTVNLAPADTRNDGSAFDLPIALGILAADKKIDASALAEKPVLVMGELSLDGSVRPVAGVMPALLRSVEQHVVRALIPKANEPEAVPFASIDVASVSSLQEAVDQVGGNASFKAVKKEPACDRGAPEPCYPDFAMVVGQRDAVRSLALAATGRHNVLMTGPPGCGKTLMARCLGGILPPWTKELALEATCLHSLRSPGLHLLAHRPFRSPHHSVSPARLLGGGNPLRPGEVSLAHGGVLFIDELPEFSSRALEGLREPMQDRVVTLSRARHVESFPADFQLVAAMNPCPCSLGSLTRNECRCSERRRRSYLSRISNPLLDRIDMHVMVPAVDPVYCLQSSSTDSAALATSVLRAANRLANEKPRIHEDAERALTRASSSLGLSMRAMSSVRRIAQTICAYDQEDVVVKRHVSEAIRLGGQGRRAVVD